MNMKRAARRETSALKRANNNSFLSREQHHDGKIEVHLKVMLSRSGLIKSRHCIGLLIDCSR